MGIHFQKFSINTGIHFASWVAHPFREFGQVPPTQALILTYLFFYGFALFDDLSMAMGPLLGIGIPTASREKK